MNDGGLWRVGALMAMFGALSCVMAGPALAEAAVPAAGAEVATSAQALTDLQACRAIAAAGARLACFDRAAAALDALAREPAPGSGLSAASSAMQPASTAPTPTASSVSAPSMAAAPGVAAPTPLDPQQKFGLPEKTVAAKEVAAGIRAAELANIQSRVSGWGRGANGLAILTLDNGQVWRQLSAGDAFDGRVGDMATVSRGFLGSFWLQLSSGRGCKVSRVL